MLSLFKYGELQEEKKREMFLVLTFVFTFI